MQPNCHICNGFYYFDGFAIDWSQGFECLWIVISAQASEACSPFVLTNLFLLMLLLWLTMMSLAFFVSRLHQLLELLKGWLSSLVKYSGLTFFGSGVLLVFVYFFGFMAWYSVWICFTVALLFAIGIVKLWNDAQKKKEEDGKAKEAFQNMKEVLDTLG